MLANPKIIAFVATKSPIEARLFYEQTLGLKFVAQEPSALVFDSIGTMLRVSVVQDFKPHPFTILGWQVADIRQAIRDLVAKGVTFERYDFVEQDEDNIWNIPDGTKVAWFKDPDGNLLSLTQFPI